MAYAVRRVRAVAPSGKDPPDRVRTPCGDPTRAKRARQTGNLLVLGLHLHLRSIPPGTLPASTENSARPSAGEAAGYQGGAAAANAPADPNPGIMAEAGRDRPLRLLCSPDQCSGALCVPALRDRSLAASATAAKPEGRLHVGPQDESGRRLAPRAAHPSPLARPAPCRQTPKVGAGCSNRARPDLCGGCSAMSIPTANQGHNFAVDDMLVNVRFWPSLLQTSRSAFGPRRLAVGAWSLPGGRLLLEPVLPPADGTKPAALHPSRPIP